MKVLELFNNGRKSAESTLYTAVSSIFFNSWHVYFIIEPWIPSHACFQLSPFCSLCHYLFPVSVLKRAHTSSAISSGMLH